MRYPLRSPLARRWASTAALSLLFAAGCVSKLTGNEGNLVFSYTADDDLLDFNKAIAAGARLDLSVAEVGSSAPAQVQTAVSSDAKVFTVAATATSAVTVEGVADGNARLEVEARIASGDTVSDSVDLRVRKATKVELRHFCTTFDKAHYLTGNVVGVPYELKLDDGQPAIGYGYHPVTISPASGATLDKTLKSQQFLWLTIGDTAGTVVLASALDTGKLTLEVVTPGAIDGALLDGDALATTALVGTNKLVHVRPSVGGAPICGADTEMTATSTAPEICSVKALTVANDAKGVIDLWGWVEVSAKKIGSCTFEVHYPKGKDGAGLKATLALPVKELVGG